MAASCLDVLYVRRVELLVVPPGEEVLGEDVQDVGAEDAVVHHLAGLGVGELCVSERNFFDGKWK